MSCEKEYHFGAKHSKQHSEYTDIRACTLSQIEFKRKLAQFCCHVHLWRIKIERAALMLSIA